MKIKPEVSVIMSVYNGEKHIDECIRSIHEQTHSNFEFIIVNDASTDTTVDILKSWKEKDNRIRILHNKTNKERAISRNRAILAAQAPLIAVIDADDCALPERLSLQTAFMRENPEVQILGGGMLIYDTNEHICHLTSNDLIRSCLFFDCAIFHPTTMLRKEVLTKYNKWYNPMLPPAEDYGLWGDLLLIPEAVFSNITTPLVRYRASHGTRPQYELKQFNNANLVRSKIIDYLGLKPTDENIRCHLGLLFKNASAWNVTPKQCAHWGKQLIAANTQKPLTSPSAFEATIIDRIEKVFTVDAIQKFN